MCILNYISVIIHNLIVQKWYWTLSRTSDYTPPEPGIGIHQKVFAITHLAWLGSESQFLATTKLRPLDNHQPMHTTTTCICTAWMLQLHTWKPLNICHKKGGSRKRNSFWMVSLILKASKCCATKNINTLYSSCQLYTLSLHISSFHHM